MIDDNDQCRAVYSNILPYEYGVTLYVICYAPISEQLIWSCIKITYHQTLCKYFSALKISNGKTKETVVLSSCPSHVP